MGNYTEMYFHFVWATKRRQPFITHDVEAALFDHIRARCCEQRAFIYALNGMPDHVHLACALPTSVCVGDFVGKIKGASAHGINQRAAQEGKLQMCLYLAARLRCADAHRGGAAACGRLCGKPEAASCHGTPLRPAGALRRRLFVTRPEE